VDPLHAYKFDTILMNPPFGTKYQDKQADNENSKFGIDMQFLYILKFSSKLGLKMEVISELRYNIPKVEKLNQKK
jgi:predicted RNA methylase